MQIFHTQLFARQFDSEDEQDFLLITVLPEPLAHAVAAQLEEKHRETMAYFWQIAEQFFYYRNVIA